VLCSPLSFLSERNVYETRTQPLLPRRQFLLRFAQGASVTLVIIGVSLFAGMLGYHCLEDLSWIDAFLNAAMLLGGMGPVNEPSTVGGKLFAGLYALYCGLVVLVAAGVLFAPIGHRLMHKFHLEGQKNKS
jgi:hypothetical protein